jgi:hypothetical protein
MASAEPDVEFLKNNYQYFQEWWHWHDKAVRLRLSAHALFKSYVPALRAYQKAMKVAERQLRKSERATIKAEEPDALPAFSLFGAALENLFKGLIVLRDPAAIGADRLSGRLHNHNLVVLAKNGGFKLSAEEQHLLEWVSEVVVWKARYPVPKDIANRNFWHPLDRMLLNQARQVMSTLDAIYSRAKKALPRRPRRAKYGILIRF